MRILSWFLSLTFSLLLSASALLAEPIGSANARGFTNIQPATVVSLSPDSWIARETPTIGAHFGRILLPQNPAEKPILLAGRCGSSNMVCSNPTPYCCGTGPANYYCAKDVNGCTR